MAKPKKDLNIITISKNENINKLYKKAMIIKTNISTKFYKNYNNYIERFQLAKQIYMLSNFDLEKINDFLLTVNLKDKEELKKLAMVILKNPRYSKEKLEIIDKYLTEIYSRILTIKSKNIIYKYVKTDAKLYEKLIAFSKLNKLIFNNLKLDDVFDIIYLDSDKYNKHQIPFIKVPDFLLIGKKYIIPADFKYKHTKLNYFQISTINIETFLKYIGEDIKNKKIKKGFFISFNIYNNEKLHNFLYLDKDTNLKEFYFELTNTYPISNYQINALLNELYNKLSKKYNSKNAIQILGDALYQYIENKKIINEIKGLL